MLERDVRPSAPRGPTTRTPQRPGVPTVVALQRSVGNRAVAGVLARRVAAQDVGKVDTGAGGTPGAGTDIDVLELGDIGAAMADYVEGTESFTKTSRAIAGFLGKVWDVYELSTFALSGGKENRGDAAAFVAKATADVAEKKAVEQFLGKRVAWGLRIGGRVVWVAWTTWEAFKVGAALAEAEEARVRRIEASRAEWRHLFMGEIWIPYIQQLVDDREEYFDQLMDDEVGYAQRPPLSKQAAIELTKHLNAISDSWRLKLAEWQEAAAALAVEDGPVMPGAISRAQAVHGTRMKELVASIADDLRKVRDYSNDPRNWELTDKQRDLLVGKWGYLPPVSADPHYGFPEAPNPQEYLHYIERERSARKTLTALQKRRGGGS